MELNQNSPILVVSSNPATKHVLTASLHMHGGNAMAFDSFAEAELFAQHTACSGIIVDLVTMIKSKGEEKQIAYTLSEYFPVLKVKALGFMLVPMAMSGDAAQDKSLSHFVDKTCAAFTARKLRSSRRRCFTIPVTIKDQRAYTTDISWTGMFVATPNTEVFTPGEVVEISMPTLQISLELTVVKIIEWGFHTPPGIGGYFSRMTGVLEDTLYRLLKVAKDNDRDRL